MSMSDPIADMLTRIRNACGSKHRRVDIPVSRMKTEIARILKENNYIQDYSTLETEEGLQGRHLLGRSLHGSEGALDREGEPVVRTEDVAVGVGAARRQ